ncbi:MAG: hypothetical protein K0R82_2423 [Flavipsychrobacter sp.]|jgi:hypothetical protein|nr:hypothetical protein [Flavipsychrobacter sp.]
MKKIGYLIACILFTCLTAVAQPRSERGERIRAIKADFIAERIHLTPQQANRFWPIYNQYENDQRAVRNSFRSKYPQQKGSRDEHQSRQFIDDNIEFREERLNVERRYKNEFLRVISAQQLAQMYEAEREFKRMLIQNLKERGGGQGGRRGGPPRGR